MTWLKQSGLTRRRLLGGAGALAGAMLLPRASWAIGAVSSADIAMASVLAGRNATVSDRLTLTVPPTYDYGSTVPLAIAVDSPMTASDCVRRLHVFADGNPLPEVIILYFTPGNGPASIATRFRLEKGNHTVHVLAELSDGSVLTASVDVTSASGGCGGNSVGPVKPEPEPVPRIKLAERAGRGEIVEVNSMIAHRMETGFRTDGSGNPLPRHIINKMECCYGGQLVFAAKLTPAIAANAYLKFPLRAVSTGDVDFAWYEDGGAIYRATRHITVD